MKEAVSESAKAGGGTPLASSLSGRSSRVSDQAVRAICTALSWWLAVRARRQAGQADRRAGKRWAGHFLGFFAVGYLFTLYVPEYGFTTAGVLVASGAGGAGMARNADKNVKRTDPEVEGLEELGALRGLLEHRIRLAICVLLSEHDAMSFSRLKQVLCHHRSETVLIPPV